MKHFSWMHRFKFIWTCSECIYQRTHRGLSHVTDVRGSVRMSVRVCARPSEQQNRFQTDVCEPECAHARVCVCVCVCVCVPSFALDTRKYKGEGQARGTPVDLSKRKLDPSERAKHGRIPELIELLSLISGNQSKHRKQWRRNVWTKSKPSTCGRSLSGEKVSLLGYCGSCHLAGGRVASCRKAHCEPCSATYVTSTDH